MTTFAHSCSRIRKPTRKLVLLNVNHTDAVLLISNNETTTTESKTRMPPLRRSELAASSPLPSVFAIVYNSRAELKLLLETIEFNSGWLAGWLTANKRLILIVLPIMRAPQFSNYRVAFRRLAILLNGYSISARCV